MSEHGSSYLDRSSKRAQIPMPSIGIKGSNKFPVTSNRDGPVRPEDAKVLGWSTSGKTEWIEMRDFLVQDPKGRLASCCPFKSVGSH
jgi:hypothetical protein